MSLSGSIGLDFFYVAHTGNPEVATFKSFQYTLLTRGEDIRRTPGVVIRDILNNQPNSCQFTVDGGAPQPQVGEKVEIRDEKDNDRLLFAGTVQSVTQIYEGQTDQIAWQVQAIDFTWLLNRKRPFGNWVNVSVSTIVKELIARYAPGFTTEHVQTNLAKVTLTLDGSEDLVTVLNDLASAIGGGHWDVDYAMDVHFFHVVPSTLNVPPGPIAFSFDHMTVSEGAATGAGSLFEHGYYLFRHTFLYSDGSETFPMAVSNIIKLAGTNVISFTGIPLGVSRGTLTCVGRRIYYNKFITGTPGGEPIEKIHGFCQISDNTTTAFTTFFGVIGASSTAIKALGSVKTYSTPLVATPGVPPWVLLSDQAATRNLVGDISNGVYGNPNGVKMTPPATTGTVGTFGSVPAGWTVGSTIRYAYTKTNANGETTLGAVGTVTLTSAGLRFLAPLGPDGEAYMVLYVSDDGVEYHDIGAGLLPGQGVNFITPRTLWQTFPSPPSVNTAVIGIARGWVGYNGMNLIADGSQIPPVPGGNIVYFASADVAAVLEAAVDNAQAKPPELQFTGHLPGPSAACNATIDTFQASGAWNGIAIQFKVAFLYRDGSVSFPGPASPTAIQLLVNGTGVKGYNLTQLPLGPTLDSNDVVARFVYWSTAGLTNPNYSINFAAPVGFVWPVGFNTPDWSGGWTGGIVIVPDNTSTSLLQFELSALDSVNAFIYTGAACGQGNLPYGNQNAGALSTDPIPMWPNPDGPYLENKEPPDDIDDNNTNLLHEDSGSQPFTVTTDLSQVRNKVSVIGSGSVTSATANVGDSQISVADIAAFSPSGGTVKYDDPGTGDIVQIDYKGVTGTPGNTAITLRKPLTVLIPQGANISNYFVAEDTDSQKLLAKIELDVNGAVTDGIHEYVIVDTSMKAVFQLYMRAYAELELFSKPIVTIKYATRDPKTVSGATVHCDLTHPPCLGDFLIQDVTIDQIHDESDQLLPRYTATASSTKFDLNDLLLKILGSGTTAGAGNSQAGIVPAGVAQAESGGSTGLPNATLAVRKWSAYGVTFLSATNNLSLGLANGWNSTGSSANQDDVNPGMGGIAASWIRYLPVSNNGNLCGINCSARAYWEFLPRVVARFRTGAKLFNINPSSHRLWWIALVTGSGLGSGGDETSVTSPHVACMCKDPGDANGSWEIQTVTTGASSTVSRVRSNLGFAPLLPNTHYRVTIAGAIFAATVTVEDLTRGLSYTASVPTIGYTSDQIPGTSNDQFFAQIYGSATVMAAEITTGAGGIDIGAGYFESN